MTFIELIRRQHWLSIETELIRLYPDQEKQIDAYREVFNYEMTFFSFDQEEIAEQLEDLNKTMEEFKNMTPEAKRRNTKSLDDFLRELDEGEKE